MWTSPFRFEQAYSFSHMNQFVSVLTFLCGLLAVSPPLLSCLTGRPRCSPVCCVCTPPLAAAGGGSARGADRERGFVVWCLHIDAASCRCSFSIDDAITRCALSIDCVSLCSWLLARAFERRVTSLYSERTSPRMLSMWSYDWRRLVLAIVTTNSNF